MMMENHGGTAGAPMLKILLEQNLSNVLVIVTRYFGGILLGTGGLVRAYSDATKKALEKTEYITKQDGYLTNIEIEYKELEKAKYYLEKNNIRINQIQYLENIELTVELTTVDFEKITNSNNEKPFEFLKTEILTKKYVEI